MYIQKGPQGDHFEQSFQPRLWTVSEAKHSIDFCANSPSYFLILSLYEVAIPACGLLKSSKHAFYRSCS